MVRGCPVGDLQPGMRLAAPVTDGCGRMVLTQGTELNQRVIDILRRLNLGPLDVVRWQEDGTLWRGPAAETLPDQGWHPGPFCSITDPLWDFFQERYGLLLQLLKQHFAQLAATAAAPSWEALEEAAGEIGDLALLAVQVLPCIHFMPRLEPYLLHHSLHVSFLTAMLARQTGLGEGEVREAALAALLHDVGKLQVPGTVLHKQQPLTPQEVCTVRGHAVLGFRLLQEAGRFSLPVLAGVLQHHERLDGSGYPTAAGAAKTHGYAKLIAVADMYDAMTSQKMYGRRHNPFTAARELRRDMCRERLDGAATRALLAQIHQFLVGQKVRLDNGEEGWLVQWDEGCGERATVTENSGKVHLLHDRCGLAIDCILRGRGY